MSMLRSYRKHTMALQWTNSGVRMRIWIPDHGTWEVTHLVHSSHGPRPVCSRRDIYSCSHQVCSHIPDHTNPSYRTRRYLKSMAYFMFPSLQLLIDVWTILIINFTGFFNSVTNTVRNERLGFRSRLGTLLFFSTPLRIHLVCVCICLCTCLIVYACAIT